MTDEPRRLRAIREDAARRFSWIGDALADGDVRLAKRIAEDAFDRYKDARSDWAKHRVPPGYGQPHIPLERPWDE